jgi:hypothetical protein
MAITLGGIVLPEVVIAEKLRMSGKPVVSRRTRLTFVVALMVYGELPVVLKKRPFGSV